jgi:nitrogen fixation NifU-like protein
MPMDIESLYNAQIQALAQAAHGAGRLDAADGVALRDSPMCGDQVRIEVRVADGRITALAHQVRGCLLCRASAAMIGLHAAGMSTDDTARLRERVAQMLAGADAGEDWPELSLFVPVRAHRSRHGCVLIPFEALEAAVRAAASDG